MVTKRVIGPWKGDTHFSAEVHAHGNVVARVLLGPRMMGIPTTASPTSGLGAPPR